MLVPLFTIIPKLPSKTTNDAIIYAGTAYTQSTLKIKIKALLESTCSKSNYVTVSIFKEQTHFYKIDPDCFLTIFVINNAKTAKTFRARKIDVEVFKQSIKLQ
jgi:methenyltetrahydromethanopterin cyclohydrolase